MNVHDCMCFCGFILLVFGGIAGLIYVVQKEGEEVGRRKKEFPIVFKKDSRKGILAWLDKSGRAVVNIVWLNKDIPHGEEFSLADICDLDAILWCCDRESIEQTIEILQNLREGMKEGEDK